MVKIISLANQKGGVGKTTTSINLSFSLSKLNKKILLIDMDPQANSTSGLGVIKSKIKTDIYDVLINEILIEKSIIKLNNYLDIIPSTIQLSGAEVELSSQIAREKKLLNSLLPIKDNYDFIFIDCPPSLGLLTINAFSACDSIIIPVQSEYYALEGLSQLISTIKLVRKHINYNLSIEGVLLTMLDVRTKLGNEVAMEVKNFFKDKVYRTIIHRNVKLSEAPSYGKSIIDYSSKSRGAIEYMSLAKEVLNSGN